MSLETGAEPANVKLTHDGKPKILDFGLAKESGKGSHLSEALTVARGTATGFILGTAGSSLKDRS